MTTDTCAAFEIAIEQQAYGAASPDESAALAAHLESCPSCRAYAESASLARRGVVAMAEQARAKVDSAQLETRIRRAITTRFRRLLARMAIGCAMGALAVWGLGTNTRVEMETIAIVATVLVFRLVMVLAENRTLKLAHGDELFAAHRAALTKRVVSLRRLRWVAVGVVLLCLGLGFFLSDIGLRGRMTFMALAIGVGAVWGHNVAVEQPRLVRELRALSDSPS